MRELVEAIPDVDVLLALEPEELGAKILFLLRKRHDRGQFHPGNMQLELQQMHPPSPPRPALG